MTKSKPIQKLTDFFENHKKAILITFFSLFFLVLFVVSVSGGLRAFFPYYGQLSGFPFGHKTYLVVFQNNNELRPGGGFISSFATMDFTYGAPTALKIEDVYGDIDDHSYQKAPWPMEKLLANEWYSGYSFRDGNYSPNFPDSAKELIRLFQLTRPEEKIDGVIAVNFTVLEDLLRTLGPVKVEDKYFSNDNLFEELTNSVNDVDRHNLDSLAARKSLLKPLANSIISKILLNPFKLRKVSDTFTVAMSKKDIQLYFADEDLQNVARRYNWAGEWPSSDLKSDFLAVNEANLGGMKSDRYIKRNIIYHVRFSEEALRKDALPEANLKVQINHFGIENIPLSGPYTGYFRLFTSPFQLQYAYDLSSPPIGDNPLNSPVTSYRPFEHIITLQPGETKSISENYKLPDNLIQDNLYNLYLAKQSGTDDDNYTVIVELPRGYRIESDSFTSRENFAMFQGSLTKDLRLQLKIVPDETPPRLVLQENTELNKISLHFNEDLNLDYASDPFSYEVIDLNEKHPEKTDDLRIKKIVNTTKDIDIYLTGETSQPEERYGIRLKNLRDIHGNVLSDRQVTVVQRLK